MQLSKSSQLVYINTAVVRAEDHQLLTLSATLVNGGGDGSWTPLSASPIQAANTRTPAHGSLYSSSPEGCCLATRPTAVRVLHCPGGFSGGAA
jgi:hypothetical protein